MTARSLENKNEMAIIGGGAIGALFAAAACEAGFDVTLCVRTPIPSLVMLEGTKRTKLPVTIVTDPALVSRTEWVVLTTKVKDTKSAYPWLQALLGPNSSLIAAQNGIDQEERLRPVCGNQPILPALIYVAIEKIGLGLIRHHNGKSAAVPDTKEGRKLAHLLNGKWLELSTIGDFRAALWRKLMTNLIANPLTALTMRRIEVMAEPMIRDLAFDLLQEAATIGRADGVNVAENDVKDTLARFANPDKTAGSSMYYDRLANAPLEHDALTGALLRIARRHHVPAPLNQAIYALLDALDKGQRIKKPAN